MRGKSFIAGVLMCLVVMSTIPLSVFADTDYADPSTTTDYTSTVSADPETVTDYASPTTTTLDTTNTPTSPDTTSTQPDTTTTQTDTTTDTSNTPTTPTSPTAPTSDSTTNTQTTETNTNTSVQESTLSSSGVQNYQDKSKDITNPEIKLTPDSITGALEYSYPIAVPSGRNSITTPTIKLNYNNQVTEETSPYGYGWTDNIPYIERMNKTGSNNIFNTYNFYSSIDGELASTSATSYIAKIDSGDFNKYTFTNNTWIVTDKQGTTFTYGSVANTRLDNPNDSSQIFRWMLEEVRDTNNNYIKYTYFKDNGQIYPLSIIYSGNGSINGVMEVDFQHQIRTDISTSYKSGFSIAANYVINEIDTKVNNSLVHKYLLVYSKGNNGQRSLLSTVNEIGIDENNNSTTLPSTSFTYSTSTPTFTLNTNFNSPLIFSYYYGAPDHGVQEFDVNGDGLNDEIQAYTDQTGLIVRHSYINNGNGFSENSAWNMPISFVTDLGNNNIDYAVRIADINGDGLNDEIQAYTDQTGPLVRHTYINNGNGFSENSAWNMPISFITDWGNNDDSNDIRLVDINGDGLTDVIQAKPIDNAPSQRHVYINTGNGFTEDPTWNLPLDFTYFFNAYRNDNAVRLVDINNDGLVDIMQSIRDDYFNIRTKTYINNGHGFTEDPAWNSPVYFIDTTQGGTMYDNGVRFVDLNADGLKDIVQEYNNNGTIVSHIYINNGHGFTENFLWTLPHQFATLRTSGQRVDEGTRTFDINGDGVEDLVWAVNTDPTEFRETYINNTSKPDVLTSITLSKGGSINIQYQATPQYHADGTTTPQSPHLPFVLQTVKAIGTNDGLGHSATTTYSYTGGTYYFADPLTKKIAGFQTITETDPSGNVTKTYYHTGTGTDTAHGEYQDNVSKIGRAYRIEKYDDKGNLYQTIINTWDSFDRGNGVSYVKLTQVAEEDYDGLLSHKDKAVQYTYDNTTGNLTQKKELGEVQSNDDGVVLDAAADDYTTTITYASTTGSNVIGLPSDETTIDHNNVKVSETRHYYDQLDLGNVGKGNETKTEQLKSGTSYINTQKTYNAYGLVTTAYDPRGKTTNYIYDSYNLYPSTVTNALNQTTQYLYNYGVGKIKQVTDPNNLVTKTTYDGFGRTALEEESDPSLPSSLVTKASYSYNDNSFPTSVEKTDYLSGSLSTISFEYIDGLNRLLQTKTSSETPSTYIAKDTLYNNRGLVASQSLPYFSQSAGYTPANSNSALVTSYEYDALGRVGTTTNVVGKTTNKYVQWKTTITNPLGVMKDLYSDAYGNLVKVIEYNRGSAYFTSYAYNGLGNLTSITDADNNVRNFTYDGLGRRLTSQDLHSLSDTTFGSTTYSYDDSGNILEKIDPKSEVVDYTYDDLNRPLTEDFTGQSGIEVSYGYDTCTLGIGKLCSATTTGAVSHFTYDSLGNVADQVTKIGSIFYHTYTDHDRQGNVIHIKYPDESEVEYSYNTAGLQDSVSWKEATSTSYTPIVLSIDYSPLGQPTVIHYQNNVVTNNNYDSGELYRLRQKITTNSANEQLQNMLYTYDALGNIKTLADTSNSSTTKNVSYGYDDLSRLTEASTTNAANGQNYSQIFSYGPTGNILINSASGMYRYTGNVDGTYANPHAVTAVGPYSYKYDLNGNLVSSNVGNLNVWDYRNQLIQSSLGAGTTTYDYDYAGARVRKMKDTTTLYPNENYTQVGATTTKNIVIGNQLVATIQSCVWPGDATHDGTTDFNDLTRLSQNYNSPHSGISQADFNGDGMVDFGDQVILSQNYNTSCPSSIASTTVQYVTTDHLSGANIITDKNGSTTETIDYYPYGSTRFDIRTTSFNEKNKFTGKELDAETGFNYFGARYYDAHLGRFISEDPAYLAVGNDSELKSKTGLKLDQYLADPQVLNSYSYARNNPIINTDPTGNFVQYLMMLFWPSVVHSPAEESELQNNNLENALFVASFINPEAGAEKAVANETENLTTKVITKYTTHETNQSLVNFAAEYTQNLGLKMTERNWSSGDVKDNLGNLVQHYIKHGEVVGTKSAQEYYNKANSLINSVDNKNIFKINNLYSNGSVDYFDITTKNLVGLDKNGNISTFHQVTNLDKLNGIMNAIKK